MKRLMLLTVVCLMTVGIHAQSLWDGFINEISPQLVADNAKSPLSGTYLIRLDVGLSCPSFGFKTNEEGKITGTEGRDYSKLFAGLLFTHVKPDGTRDWGIGGGVTIPYVEGGRYGFAILGGYSVFKVGIDYAFGLKPAQAVSFLGGLTVDLFNLTE